LAAVLFAAWIAWLAYLALPSTTPREVLSPAQFLVSTLDVVAQVDADGDGRPIPRVKVEEIHWPAHQAQQLVGQVIPVNHLERFDALRGWTGPGLYIMPLIQTGGHYQVASPPRSPGYDGGSPFFPRIYPATPLNRRQLAAIRKPE
jgi:hypothetical protein